jgi:hypothetical protein
MATNIINQNLQNLQDPDTDMNQMIPEGGINFNDVKNYASIPATYAAGLYGNYINKNVGENMARSFRTDEMNERLSQQVGDQLPEGVNSGSLTYTDFGLDPVREYLGGGEYKNTRDYNPPSLEKAISLNSADAANAHTLGNLNFTKDPSGNINYTGNRFDFPYSTTLNNDPMTIPLDELNVNAPQFSFTNYLQGKNDFNIGTPISSTTNFNDSYNYNDVDAMTADEQGQLPFDQPTQNKNFLTGILESLSDLELQDYLPFGEKSISSMAARGAGNMVRGIGNFFQGNPRQRARNEANKRFGVGDIYGYGMGPASGGNRLDAFGFNTVSGFGNYEQHMRDQLDKLNARKEAGKTFKPGSWQNRMLKDYGESISTIDAEAAAADRAERDKFNRMLSNMSGGGGGSSYGGTGYEGMSDAASDQERSEGGRGKR